MLLRNADGQDDLDETKLGGKTRPVQACVGNELLAGVQQSLQHGFPGQSCHELIQILRCVIGAERYGKYLEA